jgi:hypothetical protein
MVNKYGKSVENHPRPNPKFKPGDKVYEAQSQYTYTVNGVTWREKWNPRNGEGCWVCNVYRVNGGLFDFKEDRLTFDKGVILDKILKKYGNKKSFNHVT